MARIVKIDAVGIVERAKTLMPPPLPKGVPHDAALIRQQLAWAHAMILSGSLCPRSEPAFKARCSELLEMLDLLRASWACHFGRNWKTGEPLDPRMIHPTPLDEVILAARVGPFQLYRYEPIRRVARAVNVIESLAMKAKAEKEVAAEKAKPYIKREPTWSEKFEADKKARLEQAKKELEQFRSGTQPRIKFPSERDEEWHREVARMRKMRAANAWWNEKQRVRERGPRQRTR